MRIFFILLLLGQAALAQNFTDSNLPIVIINTDNDANGNPIEIVDDPKVSATMKIIKRPDGSRNYLTDVSEPAYLNYNGKIGIEFRGSSSQNLPKKPYGITTVLPNGNNNNVSLLGMPSENDWVLNSFAYDQTLMRDYITYHLSRQIGQYAARTAYCEVVVNGDYKGLYLLSEKIKIDGNRVNITKITTTDNTLPTLSGGYITKADKTTGGDPIAWTMASYFGNVNFIHESPKPEDITSSQAAYIESVFTQLETHVSPELTEGYPSIIDVPTFVDYMLLAELTSNADAYQFSTFFHKDRNGKLRAGPIWDYNLTFGNDIFQAGYDRSKTDVWQFYDGGNTGSKFWKDLFDDAAFHCYLSKRYQQLTQTGQPLDYTSVSSLVDQTTDLISEALVREHTRWQTIPDHAQAVSDLKSWLQLRMQWMNTRLANYSTCESIAIPSLVITKIHYNPKTSGSFTVSNDLEFIELQNTGSTAIDLTGIYFKELGLSYQFPAQSSLAAGERLYLASHAETFLSKYSIPAFGQFTRNLSNSSQNLVVADAFGNIIDRVNYTDRDPWPSAADGGGQWLELIDTNLDNNLASSWIASSTPLILDNQQASTANQLSIYPNPTNNELSIKATSIIYRVEVLDMLGESLTELTVDADVCQLNLSALNNGIYFLKINYGNSIRIEKVIKH
ncbi:MAG: secretion system protein Por [Cytophagaceae bacterium]|jgi:hypothetical protein|nr:secretion system protein Por [Cytophagaceae bacterium]